MSPLQKVINTLNPCLTPRTPKGGVLNNEQFAKVPFRGFRGENTFWSVIFNYLQKKGVIKKNLIFLPDTI